MSESAAGSRPAAPRRPVVAFQGSRTGRSAFALINARWSRALSEGGTCDVVDHDPARGRMPDVLIHHDFASHFTEFDPPAGTRAVAVRTWDFGPLPRAWAARINARFAQYWAHSRWIAEQARAAGVGEERIRVVPHGVDPLVFRPDGDAYPLDGRRRFAFLFVGGVCFRKGTDTLLKAYDEAFSANDDVALVIKDHSQDLFYREDTIRQRMADMARDPGAPALVHIDGFLSEADLAALYRACDVAVFPYRAEGFCMPILECMASGTPAIAPRFGACLDFCSDETSYLIPAQRIHVPVHRRFKVALGFSDDVDEVDFCEVRVATLAEALRRAYEAAGEERERKAAAGIAAARGRFTWAHAIDRLRECLSELLADQAAASMSR